MTAHEHHTSLYMTYLDICNAHDFAGMAAFYTASITVNDAPTPPAAVAAQFAPIVAAFPDLRWEMRHIVVDGDFIAAHFTVTGTHRGSFNGIEATGRRISVSEITLYHLDGDMFDEIWDLVDMETFDKQLR